MDIQINSAVSPKLSWNDVNQFNNKPQSLSTRKEKRNAINAVNN
jgi:hypothetical protein